MKPLLDMLSAPQQKTQNPAVVVGLKVLICFLSVMVVTIARSSLIPVLGLKIPWIFYFVAVIVSSYYGGFVFGSIATIFAAMLGVYYFVEPLHTFVIPLLEDQISVVLFCVVSLFISSIVDQLVQMNLRSKEMVEDLNENQQLMSLALKAGQMAAWNWIVGHDVIDQWVNQEGLLGTCPRTFSEYLKLVHPEDLEKVKTLALSTIAEGKDHSIEYRIIRPDNRKEIWIEDRVHCENDKFGRPLRVAGVLIDVTPRKKYEDRLRQYARDLENAKELAESANQAKSQFLANMSHEIRTPLGVILGFAELLQDESLSGVERKQSLETIQRNGDILSKVINEILDLSRIESNKMTLEICSFPLRPLVEEMKTFFFFQAQNKGLFLDIQLDEFAPTKLESDPTRLKQILVNLIGNAIKFTENGGITVKVRKSKILNDGVDLLVCDTGPGIDTNYANDLFQPFSQLDMTMTRRYGGSGLGLAIAKKYANALGGNVELFETKKGVGTTFIVSLPTHYSGKMISQESS